jgi:hypothetical protein
MAFSQGSRTRLTYVVESTFGTTPGTPTMIEIPINTHSLDLTRTRVQGNEIRSDRIPRYDRHGQNTVTGDIVVDFRAADYDDFIESAFFDTVSSGVLKCGTVPQFMSIEDGALDIGMYRQFKGMAVNSLQMSITPDNMVQMTFGMVGKTMAAPTATTLNASPTAPSGNDPVDSYEANTVLTVNGAAVQSTSFGWTLTNDLSPAFSIGSQDTSQLQYGKAVVEGEVVVYYEDDSVLDLFYDETEFAIVSAVSDGTNTYTFTFPRCKANGAAVPLSDPQSRLITVPFVALYDDTEETNLKLVIS